MKLKILIDKNCPNKNPICLPAKFGDAGLDLVSWVDSTTGRVTLYPHTMTNIRTGASIKIPKGHWGDIRPRSSTFLKRHLFVMNSTIDEGYTGEISYVVWNPTDNTCVVNNGDRLAQLIIIPRVILDTQIVKKLPKTKRGTSGFGSTGV